MNKAILMGRLTRDPEVRHSQGENQMAIARYTLAVDRAYSRGNDDPGADFISCVAFGKSGEFAEKYFRKGTKIVVIGRIQTGSYTNKDGVKVYTTDVVVESQEFAESKAASQGGGNNSGGSSYPSDGGYQQNNGRRQQQGGGNGNGRNSGGNNGGSNGGYGGGNNSGNDSYGGGYYGAGSDGFMNIPDGIDEELPFN